MANKTVLKKEKHLNSRGSRYFTSGNARAYLFIHLFKPSNCITEFSELTCIPSRKYIYFWETMINTATKSILVQWVVLLYGKRNFIGILKNQPPYVNSCRKSASNLLKRQKPWGRVVKRKYNLNGISTTLRRQFRWKLFAFFEFPGL